MCSWGIYGWVLIDTLLINPLEQYLIDNQLLLCLHLGWHLIHTWSTSPLTVSWVGQLIFNWCIWVSWHLANYWLALDRVSIKWGLSIDQDVDRLSIEMSIKGIDQFYGLRELINTWSHHQNFKISKFQRVYYFN